MTTTVNKLRGGDKLSHVDSFNAKNIFSEGQKNLVNSENKENLSNYRLLKRKTCVCSTSLHFSKLITVIQFFFSRNNGSAMVLMKFAREVFAAGDRVRVHCACSCVCPRFSIPAKWPIRPGGAYPGLYSMMRLGVFLLPLLWMQAPSQG